MVSFIFVQKNRKKVTATRIHSLNIYEENKEILYILNPLIHLFGTCKRYHSLQCQWKAQDNLLHYREQCHVKPATLLYRRSLYQGFTAQTQHDFLVTHCGPWLTNITYEVNHIQASHDAHLPCVQFGKSCLIFQPTPLEVCSVVARMKLAVHRCCCR